MLVILTGCPKDPTPKSPASETMEIDWPEDEDLEDLPEAGEDEED